MVSTEQNIPPLTLSIVASIEDTFMYLFSTDPIVTLNIIYAVLNDTTYVRTSLEAGPSRSIGCAEVRIQALCHTSCHLQV